MDDQILLKRYVATRDSAAFEELVRRYASLVKGGCVRVLGNTHDAEEVAQECFLELARNAEHVHSSVGGWLHRAATSRSLNVLRSRSRRKARERDVSIEVETPNPVADVTTHELQRIVSSALTEMPDDLRIPMILHFFDGRSQRDVALELGVNQSTISRRMQEALQRLREKLTQAGFAATAPAVMVLMQDQAIAAASDSQLTQVAVSGIAGKAAGSATFVSSLKTAATASLPILSYLILGGWMSLLIGVGVGVYVARYRPAWLTDVFSSLGLPKADQSSTIHQTQWDWAPPLADSRPRMLSSFVWSLLFFGLSLAFAIGTAQPPWGIVILGLVVSLSLLRHPTQRAFCQDRTSGRAVSSDSPGKPRQLVKVVSRDALAPGLEWRTLRVLTHPGSLVSTDREVDSRFAATRLTTSGRGRTGIVQFLEQFVGLPQTDSRFDWFDVVQLIGIGLAGVGLSVRVLVRSEPKTVWPAVVMCGAIGTWMLVTGILLCQRWMRTAPWCVETESALESAIKQQSIDIEKGRPWTGTESILAFGVSIVVALSFWIVWNPSAVRGISLSLAAIQTSILGWIVYRLTMYCRGLDLYHVRRVVILFLVSCFVLNSGVCLANWLW